MVIAVSGGDVASVLPRLPGRMALRRILVRRTRSTNNLERVRAIAAARLFVVVATVAVAVFAGIDVTAHAAGSSSAAPAATTTTTAPNVASASAPALPAALAPSAAPAPSAAAAVPAAAAPLAESSQRATGARAHFAPKAAAVLPRPALTRGVPAEPVAGLASQLTQLLTGGRAAGSIVDLRTRLATIVAGRITSATAAQLDAVWAAAPKARQLAVFTALAQVGKPYQFASPGPDAFDCSGLTRFAWKAAGVDLPHNDEQQIALVAPRTPTTILPGDLVQHPGHVSMYLGAGHAIVHAEQSHVPVKVTDWSASAVRWGSPLP